MAHTLLRLSGVLFRPRIINKNGENRMKYRSFVTLFSAVALIAGTLTPAFAQRYGSDGSEYVRSDEGYDSGDAARRWDRFLDQDENRNFAQQYRGNPNIIHDSREMDQWTGVRELFNDHPDVRDYVYNKVREYNQDTRPAEKWNRELEANPSFADRFRQNPSIVNDSNLENDEPQIAEFMRTNPDVRPYLDSYASRSSDRNDRDRDYRGDSDMDNFMNNHPNLARQLRENPSLVNNDDFVNNHPGLREYLRNHPDARF
jgi:hypothetical protein